MCSIHYLHVCFEIIIVYSFELEVKKEWLNGEMPSLRVFRWRLPHLQQMKMVLVVCKLCHYENYFNGPRTEFQLGIFLYKCFCRLSKKYLQKCLTLASNKCVCACIHACQLAIYTCHCLVHSSFSWKHLLATRIDFDKLHLLIFYEHFVAGIGFGMTPSIINICELVYKPVVHMFHSSSVIYAFIVLLIFHMFSLVC